MRAHYLSVTEAPHNIESLQVSGEDFFVSVNLEGPSAVRARDIQLSKQAATTNEWMRS